jgi:hypothetical protein
MQPHYRPWPNKKSCSFVSQLNVTSPVPGRKLSGSRMSDITITVSTQAELYAALQNATGGETILLAAGNYGDIRLGDFTPYACDFSSQVTLASADQEDMAVFSSVDLRGVSNLSFDSLIFDYEYSAGDVAWVSTFLVSNSNSISITNSLFDGDLAQGTGTPADDHGFGKALGFTDSTDIIVDGNQFYDWERAATFVGVTNLVVANNDIHNIRSDGLDFVSVKFALIEGNYIHDFNTAPETGDHADFIQFWDTTTSDPSSDVIIRANILDIGDGGATELIFMRNGQAEQNPGNYSLYYRNLTIEDNVLLGDYIHGITVGETVGLTVANNTVLAVDGALMVPQINIASTSTDVNILQNAVVAVAGYLGQSDWLLSNNVFIQNTDPDAPGYYRDVFVESSMFSVDGASGFLPVPGGVLDQLGAGSSLLSVFTSGQPAVAAFDVWSISDSTGTIIFDGQYSLAPEATYEWFVDSVPSGNGSTFSAQFTAAGVYLVELKVILPDGFTSSARAFVSIAGDDLVSYNSQDGAFHLLGYGTDTVLEGSETASVTMQNGLRQIDLGGTGTIVTISRYSLERFFGAEGFSISVGLRAEELGSYGELFRIHGSIVVSITPTGEIVCSFTTSEGKTNIAQTTGAHLNDGLHHDLVIKLNPESHLLDVEIDGQVLGQSIVYGTAPDIGYWDLTFGDPWGGKNFNGTMDLFNLEVSNNDYPIYVGTIPTSSNAVIEESLATAYSADPAQSVEATSVSTDPNELSLDGYALDLSGAGTGTGSKLIGDAKIVDLGGCVAVSLDGQGDYVRLGNQLGLEPTGEISVGVGFARTASGGQTEALFTNKANMSVFLTDDTIQLVMPTNSAARGTASIDIASSSPIGDALHNLVVVASNQDHRIQVLLDGDVIFDKGELYFDLPSSNDRNWWDNGWTIGNGGRNGADFSGLVTQFQVNDFAQFYEAATPNDELFGLL